MPSHTPAHMRLIPDLTVHALPHVNVSSADASGPLAAIQERIAGCALVRSFAGLHRFLCDLLRVGPPGTPATLDLIGASTGSGLLQLGDSVVGAVPDVLDVAEQIGTERLLSRLGIAQVRLIGSRTAVEPAAHDAMRRLAGLLRVPVIGTTALIYADHFRSHGFDWDRDDVIADSGTLPPRKAPTLWPDDPPRARPFRFDAIHVVRESVLQPVPWPRLLIPRGFDIRSLATQLRPGEGRIMPGLLSLPRCEILIPAGCVLNEERYRIVEVLCNWELVRITGPECPDGAVYPIVSNQRFVRQFIGLPELKV